MSSIVGKWKAVQVWNRMIVLRPGGYSSMSAFVFLCDTTTEKECLERNLFGTNPGEQYRQYYSRIKVGETLFLYNFEMGKLFGPFTALTSCKANIEPSAWKTTRRSFPWQVKVDSSNVSKRPVGIDVIQKYAKLALTKIGLLPPSELSDEQVEAILAEMDHL